jgi:hypothetical protein
MPAQFQYRESKRLILMLGSSAQNSQAIYITDETARFSLLQKSKLYLYLAGCPSAINP